MAKLNLKYAVWKEGKYHVAQCLNIDVSSFGKTQKEALKNLEEALELYFEGNSSESYLQIKSPKLQDLSISVNA